ncbi:MAG: DNA mismatch repair endonuclease MutL [Desulfovibrio sp.]|nr:DNA mismatch repair endonuclease MutL [Desulfovibrio sp.]
MSVSFRHIQRLSVVLQNQIAAGEVVERPASAIKELVENSLDAKATQIDVTLERGGRDLIRVQDNGIGIPKDELELAVTRYATSKIYALQDLEEIVTNGFRGEALASLASVSRLRLCSSFADLAHELTVDFGELSQPKACALPQGTLVEVRELFGNTPARLKFLKSQNTEFKRAQDLLWRLALANLSVGFSLKNGDRLVWQFLPKEDLWTRLRNVWPAQTVESMKPFELKAAKVRIHGLAAAPSESNVRANHILLYVNGRPIQDKRLLAAVKEAYKGRLTSREYPQCLLFVEIDPHEVDVNVHPAKTEVRFQNESLLFALCVRAVQSSFSGMAGRKTFSEQSEDFEGACKQESQESQQIFSPRPKGFWGALDDDDPFKSKKRPEAGDLAEEEDFLPPWAGQTSNLNLDEAAKEPSLLAFMAGEGGFHTSAQQKNSSLRYAAKDLGGASQESELFSQKEQEQNLDPAEALVKPSLVGAKVGLVYLGQVNKTYLLFKNAKEELVVLDQHACHERVLYARLLADSFKQEGQLLLMPRELLLAPFEAQRLQEMRPRLTKMGFGLTSQGEHLQVRAIPPMLPLAEALELLKDVLAGKLNDHTDLLKTMACKGAIKAGQSLTLDEVEGLLEQWWQTPEREFCPHGRPAVLSFDANFLAKAFKRT